MIWCVRVPVRCLISANPVRLELLFLFCRREAGTDVSGASKDTLSEHGCWGSAVNWLTTLQKVHSKANLTESMFIWILWLHFLSASDIDKKCHLCIRLWTHSHTTYFFTYHLMASKIHGLGLQCSFPNTCNFCNQIILFGIRKTFTALWGSSWKCTENSDEQLSTFSLCHLVNYLLSTHLCVFRHWDTRVSIPSGKLHFMKGDRQTQEL